VFCDEVVTPCAEVYTERGVGWGVAYRPINETFDLTHDESRTRSPYPGGKIEQLTLDTQDSVHNQVLTLIDDAFIVHSSFIIFVCGGFNRFHLEHLEGAALRTGLEVSHVCPTAFAHRTNLRLKLLNALDAHSWDWLVGPFLKSLSDFSVKKQS